MNEEEKIAKAVARMKEILKEEMKDNAKITSIEMYYGIGLSKKVTYEFPL